ncbi:MAG: hypothetical protein LC126_25035 [Bryobacterales bacterium]|nr:hypothetical protein [Bryobacterales bacterium]
MNTLEDWSREIEVISGSAVLLVRVETNASDHTLHIPPAFPGREIVRQYFLQEPFVEQFFRAHALSLNQDGFHFILLNMARAADWQGLEDSLLAHEYGHIWLDVLGYRAPAYIPAAPCLPTHAGDIVQHVLIREETRRRGFDYMTFWRRNQERWLNSMVALTQGPELEACRRLQLLSAWVDAQLGSTSVEWVKRAEYLGMLNRLYPRLAASANLLVETLDGRDLWDRSLYEAVLIRTMEILRDVFDAP